MWMLCVVVGTSGCATFRDDNLPRQPGDSSVVDSTYRKKLYSLWQLEIDNTDESLQGAAPVDNTENQLFERTVSQSGCCEIVQSRTEADLVVVGKVTTEEKVPIDGLLCYLLGFIIPYKRIHTYQVQVKVSSSEDSRQYDLADSSTFLIWLPIIFALPFIGSTSGVDREVEQNIYRNILLKMQGDGLFGPPGLR